MSIFNQLRGFFKAPEPKKVWVTFEKGHLKVDINGFLSTPEGQKCLSDEKKFTQKMIDTGVIIDLT